MEALVLPAPDMVSLLAAYEPFLHARRPFVAILKPDFPLYRIPPGHRARRSDWVLRHSILLRRYCRGLAIVVPVACRRHLIRTHLTLQKPLIPTELFADEESAEEWGRARLEGSPDGRLLFCGSAPLCGQGLAGPVKVR